MTTLFRFAALAASWALLCSCSWFSKSKFVPANDVNVSVMGRVEHTLEGGLRLGYPGVTLRVVFEGTSLAVRAVSSNEYGRFLLRVDKDEQQPFWLTAGKSDAVLVQHLPPGRHTVELVRLTETWQNLVTILGFVVDKDARLLPPDPLPERRLLFIGDSVTCGEGVDPRERCNKDRALSANAFFSHGMTLARLLEAQCQLVCYGGRGLVRDWKGRRDVLNAPQFFELAVPEEGSARYDHREYPANAIVVSLGTNDFALGLPDFPDREHYVKTYVDFVQQIRGAYAGAHIFLSEGPLVNDEADPTRPQKTLLRNYIAEAVVRLSDPRVHSFASGQYLGDACNQHPTHAQNLAMLRELAPILSQTLGW